MKQTTTTRPAPWMWGTFTGPSGIQTQLSGAQAGFPSLLGLPETIPTLDIPGLTPEQQTLIQQLSAAGTASPDLAAARDQLAQLTGGPVGSSPATQAGMQAFEQLVAPQILQQQALQGTAGGGAALEALGQGATAAAVPLIQQEIANREQAVGQYGALGQQQMQQLAMALEAQGLPREVAQQQAQAMYDQLQQRFQFESGIQTWPLGMMSGFGSQETHGTMTAEDWVAAIGKGLSPSGASGSLLGGGGK